MFVKGSGDSSIEFVKEGGRFIEMGVVLRYLIKGGGPLSLLKGSGRTTLELLKWVGQLIEDC